MELCLLKVQTLDMLKNGLPNIFEKYFIEKDNAWLTEICGENPFVKFRDVPDFELAPLDKNLDLGEIDFLNSKIVYKNLHFLTPRQAADERFWAGFCHGAFYDYVRRRWGYDEISNLSTVNKMKTIEQIKNRFFFNGNMRERILMNTLSKYWWAGRTFPNDALDVLGAKDFYTKIFSIVSRSFIGNEKLRNGFVKFLRHFKARGVTLDIDKHIRSAMSELNKVGGAVILDCLSEDEVAAIMIACVEEILNLKVPAVNVLKISSDDKLPVIRVDDAPKISAGTRKIKIGDRVKVVSLDNGTEHDYTISENFKLRFPDICNEFVGKKINSVVTLGGKKFTVLEFYCME